MCNSVQFHTAALPRILLLQGSDFSGDNCTMFIIGVKMHDGVVLAITNEEAKSSETTPNIMHSTHHYNINVRWSYHLSDSNNKTEKLLPRKTTIHIRAIVSGCTGWYRCS